MLNLSLKRNGQRKINTVFTFSRDDWVLVVDFGEI